MVVEQRRVWPDLARTVSRWRLVVYATASGAMVGVVIVNRGTRDLVTAAVVVGVLVLSQKRFDLSIDRLLVVDLAVSVTMWWLYGPISGAPMITLAVVAVAPLLLDRGRARLIMGLALFTVLLETALHFLAGSVQLPLFHPPDPIPTSEFVVGEVIQASLLTGVGILMLVVATMLRRGQQALAADLDRERELNRLKDRFIATASHQLRTPLTSLKGFARTLVDEDVGPDDRAAFVAIIAEQADELHGRIEDLITFSRVGAGGLIIRPEEADLHRMVTNGIRSAGPAAERLVANEVPGELDVWADPPRVEQAIRNLVTNAIVYGSPPVRISAHRSGANVTCRVLDSGPGVEPADMDRVFEPYSRLVDDPTMSTPGLGLGLPIVRELVEAHGGNLRFVSDGDMTGVEITLPAATERAADSHSLSEAGSAR